MNSVSGEKLEFTSGHKLLHAVERMIDPPESIAALVRGHWRESPNFDVLCDRLVAHYSNRSALAGGVSALPGMIPGIGRS